MGTKLSVIHTRAKCGQMTAILENQGVRFLECPQKGDEYVLQKEETILFKFPAKTDILAEITKVFRMRVDSAGE